MAQKCRVPQGNQATHKLGIFDAVSGAWIVGCGKRHF